MSLENMVEDSVVVVQLKDAMRIDSYLHPSGDVVFLPGDKLDSVKKGQYGGDVQYFIVQAKVRPEINLLGNLQEAYRLVVNTYNKVAHRAPTFEEVNSTALLDAMREMDFSTYLSIGALKAREIAQGQKGSIYIEPIKTIV
jgi:hypothetical protein